MLDTRSYDIKLTLDLSAQSKDSQSSVKAMQDTPRMKKFKKGRTRYRKHVLRHIKRMTKNDNRHAHNVENETNTPSTLNV